MYFFYFTLDTDTPQETSGVTSFVWTTGSESSPSPFGHTKVTKDILSTTQTLATTDDLSITSKQTEANSESPTSLITRETPTRTTREEKASSLVQTERTDMESTVLISNETLPTTDEGPVTETSTSDHTGNVFSRWKFS